MSASLNDKLAAYFRARPMVWIDGKEIAQVAGYAGYRNRITDLRLLHQMTIENKPPVKVHAASCAKSRPLRRSKDKCTCQPYTKSEYRFVPDPPGPDPVTGSGHDLNACALR